MQCREQLWRGLRCREQGTEAFCLQPGEWAIPEVGPPPAAKLQMTDSSFEGQLACNLLRDPEPEPPSLAAPRFLVHGNYAR